jgi:hypothetical protein
MIWKTYLSPTIGAKHVLSLASTGVRAIAKPLRHCAGAPSSSLDAVPQIYRQKK